MKKIIGLLGSILLFTACSDGDVKVQNISFEDVTTVNVCNDNYFKIKDNEMLLIRITQPNKPPFPNEITTVATGTTPAAPRVFNINSYNQVIYRNYNGVPTAANICGAYPPATPSVIEEWTAIGGTIEITTTAVKDFNATTNATRITKYNHHVVFKNLIFQKPTGTQTYGDGNDLKFGYYSTSNTLNFPYGNQTLSSCNGTSSSVNKIAFQLGAEGFTISNLDSNLFQHTIGTRTANLGTTANVFSLNTYNANLSSAYFCNAITPATPTLLYSWSPDLTATPGTIEVTTTASSSVYTHKVHLKNVALKNNATNPVSFYLADDYYLGDLTTN